MFHALIFFYNNIINAKCVKSTTILMFKKLLLAHSSVKTSRSYYFHVFCWSACMLGKQSIHPKCKKAFVCLHGYGTGRTRRCRVVKIKGGMGGEELPCRGQSVHAWLSFLDARERKRQKSTLKEWGPSHSPFQCVNQIASMHYSRMSNLNADI